MKKSTYLSLFLILTAGTALAARPLTVDDADPADPGVFELETGLDYCDDGDTRCHETPIGLSYGLMPSVEVGIGFGFIHEKRNPGSDKEAGISDLTLGAKWQFLQESCRMPRQALAAEIKCPTADEDKGLGSGEFDYGLIWIASKSLNERTGIHVNAGYGWIGDPCLDDENTEDVFHYGIALDYLLTDGLQWIGEIFAEKEIKGGNDTAVLYNTGLRWNASESLVLDLAAGSRLSDEGPELTATAGLTWAFGAE